LSGVTRDLVIELASAHGIWLSEERLPLAEAARWDECFITSSSRHVMPITVLDGRPVGAGRVGPITRQLMALFEAYFMESAFTADTGAAGEPGLRTLG
jgi:branched-subunit amino acid aminotransferase/4-amino-4-deoxychorismate lyase